VASWATRRLLVAPKLNGSSRQKLGQQQIQGHQWQVKSWMVLMGATSGCPG